jgi:hypothetical protein
MCAAFLNIDKSPHDPHVSSYFFLDDYKINLCFVLPYIPCRFRPANKLSVSIRSKKQPTIPLTIKLKHVTLVLFVDEPAAKIVHLLNESTRAGL